MIEHALIIAGGSGTRLWPASRAATPKQLLDLGSGRSLLQQTVERAQRLEPAGGIVVVTHESQAQAVRAQALQALAAVGAAEAGRRLVILAEPQGRNTAPAVAYACAWLEAHGSGDRPLMVLWADHVVEPVERFVAAAEQAAPLAEAGRLVVLGVKPGRPETGYGYLEAGARLGDGFEVRTFHEKPDAEGARRYVAAGTFYWNSGMFVFTARAFLEEARALAPEVAGPFDDARSALAASEPRDSVVAAGAGLRAIYEKLPTVSIDYAVMEKSKRVAMVPATFTWSDVGSWDEVARVGRPSGEVASVNSSGNAVFSDIPVALAGVSDLIVVIRGGVALVCHKGSSQFVREIVDQLKASGRAELV